jgi:hypothetical protein
MKWLHIFEHVKSRGTSTARAFQWISREDSRPKPHKSRHSPEKKKKKEIRQFIVLFFSTAPHMPETHKEEEQTKERTRKTLSEPLQRNAISATPEQISQIMQRQNLAPSAN